MNKNLELVTSRLRNMLVRISKDNSDFEDLCARHAELTSDIRKLNPGEDADHAQRDEQLRRRRAHLEQEMFTIMQANTRV
ncbi:MAG: hypothetical protein R3245_03720 [Kiloniellales bacterium]|nr:hypothetical protein [Kiloniellales bacterium]